MSCELYLSNISSKQQKYLLHVFCCVCFVFNAHCANDDHYCQHLGFKVLLAPTSFICISKKSLGEQNLITRNAI
ncbi:hypothetical protein T12_12866 [Trichinella patagoniensis]|uniref:Uncharacterized protein n=1 Tax=Trichinella patagoniensis TaxID=990121 RepID=A0A0V1AAD2_9BILA|nr:hypothetical protein T12_12866 [Trichinella patagoniensis]